MKKYDVAVVIGRFQPVHFGHLTLVREAMRVAKRVVILVGSSNKSQSIKNPWTFNERKVMLSAAIESDTVTASYVVRPLRDFDYSNTKWVAEVQRSTWGQWTDKPESVVLVGHKKDESTFYLDLFPDWDYVEVAEDSRAIDEKINATDIRKLLFTKPVDYLKGVVPEIVFNSIVRWRQSGEYDRLKEEYNMIQDYKKSWAAAPYPPTFLTADAVVVQAGHILVVRRGAAPGKGLLALPGGFVNQGETIREAALRELREETGLKVPEKVLNGSIIESKVFDAPGRSLRGRTVTEAFYIELDHAAGNNKLPKVKGADDAVDAFWMPLANVKGEEFFEDHAEIIDYFVGV